MKSRTKLDVAAKFIIVLLPCALNFGLIDEATAEKASLEQCRKLQRKIDRLTSLRRGGGNATRMETWRQQRKRYEEQFREHRCRSYGKLLRDSK